MCPFHHNGWAYYEKVQEIMPLYARGTTLFHPAEGPPVSVNSGVDSGAKMIGGGESREASSGDGRDDVQGDEDNIMGAQDGVCKGNLTVLRRILHLDLAKGNPK
jgi:hypothetical protein